MGNGNISVHCLLNNLIKLGYPCFNGKVTSVRLEGNCFVLAPSYNKMGHHCLNFANTQAQANTR